LSSWSRPFLSSVGLFGCELDRRSRLGVTFRVFADDDMHRWWCHRRYRLCHRRYQWHVPELVVWRDLVHAGWCDRHRRVPGCKHDRPFGRIERARAPCARGECKARPSPVLLRLVVDRCLSERHATHHPVRQRVGCPTPPNPTSTGRGKNDFCGERLRSPQQRSIFAERPATAHRTCRAR
jgi:hypothetical protein